MVQTNSKSVSKTSTNAKAKPPAKNTTKKCIKTLNDLAADIRTTRSTIRTVLSQPPQDLQNAPGGPTWVNLQHDFEAFTIQSNKATTGIISVFEDFTGDLFTFLNGKSASYDAKIKELDAYSLRLEEAARDQESLQASNKLNSFQAHLPAVTPPKQSIITMLLTSLRGIFGGGKPQVGSNASKPQDKNRMKRQTGERNAALKASNKFLRRVQNVNFADVVISFSAEVDKTRATLRRQGPKQVSDNGRLFYNSLGTTHRNTLELLNSVREYKNALEDRAPERR